MNYGINGFQKFEQTAHEWFARFLCIFRKKVKVDWESYINKTVVIHMRDRKDRLKLLKKRTSSIKFKNGKSLFDYIYLFEAIDGSTIKWFSKKIHQNKYKLSYHWNVDPVWGMGKALEKNPTILCSAAETGIVFSHYRIWKDIVKHKTPVTLILEDDVKFSPNFQEKIKNIFEDELPPKWDMLYLSSLPTEAGFKWEPHSENISRLHNGVWWMSGYVLTYEGAKKLLNNLPIIGPVDVWINYQFDDLKTYISRTNLILQADDTISDNTYSFVETFRKKII